MPATISREEAKARLARLGKTATDVACELGVSGQIVRGVLNGSLKGATGDAHKVAVALGLNAQINAQINAAKSDPALAETNKALDENNGQNAEIIAMLRRIAGQLDTPTAGTGGTYFDLASLAVG